MGNGPATGPGASTHLTVGWRLLHFAIIALFMYQVLYATNQVFFVLAPEGRLGPLNAMAKDIPHELLLARRLYAIEGWIASAGLVVYLALTEMLPRMLGALLRDLAGLRELAGPSSQDD